MWQLVGGKPGNHHSLIPTPGGLGVGVGLGWGVDLQEHLPSQWGQWSGASGEIIAADANVTQLGNHPLPLTPPSPTQTQPFLPLYAA